MVNVYLTRVIRVNILRKCVALNIFKRTVKYIHFIGLQKYILFSKFMKFNIIITTFMKTLSYTFMYLIQCKYKCI